MKNKSNEFVERSRTRARLVASRLRDMGFDVSLAQAYEVLAAAEGAKNWATFKSKNEHNSPQQSAEQLVPEPNGIDELISQLTAVEAVAQGSARPPNCIMVLSPNGRERALFAQQIATKLNRVLLDKTQVFSQIRLIQIDTPKEKNDESGSVTTQSLQSNTLSRAIAEMKSLSKPLQCTVEQPPTYPIDGRYDVSSQSRYSNGADSSGQVIFVDAVERLNAKAGGAVQYLARYIEDMPPEQILIMGAATGENSVPLSLLRRAQLRHVL